MGHAATNIWWKKLRPQALTLLEAGVLHLVSCWNLQYIVYIFASPFRNWLWGEPSHDQLSFVRPQCGDLKKQIPEQFLVDGNIEARSLWPGHTAEAHPAFRPQPALHTEFSTQMSFNKRWLLGGVIVPVVLSSRARQQDMVKIHNGLRDYTPWFVVRTNNIIQNQRSQTVPSSFSRHHAHWAGARASRYFSCLWVESNYKSQWTKGKLCKSVFILPVLILKRHVYEPQQFDTYTRVAFSALDVQVIIQLTLL